MFEISSVVLAKITEFLSCAILSLNDYRNKKTIYTKNLYNISNS